MKVFKLKKPWKDFNFSVLDVPEKSVILVRYGAYGDMIQASSVFTALKDQGYYLAHYYIPILLNKIDMFC